MYPIYTYGSQEQKDYWIPKLAAGEAIGCFGLTEPDFGSNPGGMRTTRASDGDSWVLNGAKAWITNGSIADVAVVWAKTDGRHPRLPRREGHARLHHRRPQGQVLAARLGDLAALLRGLPHPGRERPARRRTGLKYPLGCLDPGALRHRLGRARRGDGRATTRRSSYAKARIQFGGQPIASPPARAGASWPG